MSTSWFRIAIALALGLWLVAHLALVAAGIAIAVRLGADLFAGVAPWTLARCGGVLLDLVYALLLLVPHGLLRPRRGRTALLVLAAVAVLLQGIAGAPPAPGSDALRATFGLWPMLVAAVLCALERGWRALAEPAGADDAPAGFKGESYRQVQP